jgi:acylphosphatase
LLTPVSGGQAAESETPGTGDPVSLSVTVIGRVQGVGFRAFAHDQARRLGVVGYVMNLRAGGVRVHAEGPRETLEAFLESLRRGPSGSRVQQVWATWGVASGEHDRFAIRSTI